MIVLVIWLLCYVVRFRFGLVMLCVVCVVFWKKICVVFGWF